MHEYSDTMCHGFLGTRRFEKLLLNSRIEKKCAIEVAHAQLAVVVLIDFFFRCHS